MPSVSSFKQKDTQEEDKIVVFAVFEGSWPHPYALRTARSRWIDPELHCNTEYPIAFDVQQTIEKATFTGPCLPDQTDESHRLTITSDDVQSLVVDFDLSRGSDSYELDRFAIQVDVHLRVIELAKIGRGVLEGFFELLLVGVETG